MSKTMISYLSKGGREFKISLPAKFGVCPRCEGAGKHVNPAVDGITAEEWEHDWDDDSREGYMTGRYDVTCETCDGNRVVPEIDVARLTKRELVIFAEWRRQQAQEARWRSEDRQTQFWENGGGE